MALDADIQSMSKSQVQAAIRTFKQNNKGIKLNVSGNLPELKQNLQNARDGVPSHGATAAGPSNAPRPSVGSVSVPSVVPSTTASTPGPQPKKGEKGAGPAAIMFQQKMLHPITVRCKAQLVRQGGERDEPDLLLQDQSEVERMEPMLQPIARLISVLVSVVEDMAELSGSPALNFATVDKIMRNRIPSAVAPKAALVLFQTFDIDVTVAEVPPPMPSVEEQESQELAAAVEASVDSFQAEIQKRYQMDLAESSSPPRSSSDGHGRQDSQPEAEDADETIMPEERPAEPDSLVTDPTTLPGEGTRPDDDSDEAFQNQVAVIQQSMLHFLQEWMITFPPSEKKIWPQDFEANEQTLVRQTMQDYINNKDHGVDGAAHQQPKATVDKAVAAFMQMEDFPVADAKNSSVLGHAFRLLCHKIYTRELKKKIVSEGDGVAGESGGEDGAGGGPSVGHGGDRPGSKSAGKKRARDAAEDIGEGDLTTATTRKKQRQSARDAHDEDRGDYSAQSTECMACYFFGDRVCSLAERNDPGRICETCFRSGESCRVLCSDCRQTADVAGRGTDGTAFMIADCGACDFRS